MIIIIIITTIIIVVIAIIIKEIRKKASLSLEPFSKPWHKLEKNYFDL